MVLLPKLIFLIQNIPVSKAEEKLKDSQRIYNNFIWQKQKNRLTWQAAQRKWTQGDPEIPNILIYYHTETLN